MRPILLLAVSAVAIIAVTLLVNTVHGLLVAVALTLAAVPAVAPY